MCSCQKTTYRWYKKDCLFYLSALLDPLAKDAIYAGALITSYTRTA